MDGKLQGSHEDRLDPTLDDETLKPPPPTMTDTEFAVNVDTRLWVSPSGEMRNNVENYRAVDGSLTDLDTALTLLQQLLETLIRLQSWRTDERLAAPILEGLVFVQDSVGQIAETRAEPVTRPTGETAASERVHRPSAGGALR